MSEASADDDATVRGARLVVVMGISGVGKTRVGEQLARVLGLPYADGDSFHPPQNVHKMAAGTALSDAERAPWLAAIGAFLRAQAEQGVVVSCSALRRVYRDSLRAAAPRLRFCHLTDQPERIEARMKARLDHFMPSSLLASQLATLEPLQPDEPGFTLVVAEQTPEQLAQRARTLLSVPEALP